MDFHLLVDTFKEALTEQDPERCFKLVERFNIGMKAMSVADQIIAIKAMVEEGLMPRAVLYMMVNTGGSFGGYGFNHWSTALKVINSLPAELKDLKDRLDYVAHNIKHMGVGQKDFYAIMAETRKILRFRP